MGAFCTEAIVAEYGSIVQVADCVDKYVRPEPV